MSAQSLKNRAFSLVWTLHIK